MSDSNSAWIAWPEYGRQVSFRVPGAPVAQPRPRAVMRGRRAGVYVDTSGPIGAYRDSVAALCRQAVTERFSGPVAVVLHFVFPRPQRMVWRRRPMPAEWRCTKPDIDNLAKAVMDSMNGVAWHDDGQVVAMSATKVTAAGEQDACTMITVLEILGGVDERG